MTRSHLIGVLRGALLLLGLGMDAVRPSAAPAPPAPASPPMVQVREATAFSAETLLSRGLRPVVLGALPPGMASPSAAECEGCHVREAAEWGLSLHRRSFTQPLFQEAYQKEPMAECDNCHQPRPNCAP